ncbi:MAG: PQQ-dependent sugar dehydrogenase [Actinomycetota bacterium]
MQKPSSSALLQPLLVSTGLALAVSYRFFEPIWQVDRGLLVLGVLTALAYVVGFLLHRRLTRPSFLWLVGLTLVVSQPVLLAALLLHLPIPRIALVFELALLFLALTLVAAPVSHRLKAWMAFVFVCIAAYPSLAGGLVPEGAQSPSSTSTRYVFSTYHDLSVTDYRVLEDERQLGGALTTLPGGRVLLVAGSGESRIFSTGDAPSVSPIDLELPIEVDSYRAQASDPTPYYRVTDVVYAGSRLLVSHTEWDAQRDCHFLRLVEAEFDGETVGSWATRFESQPCLSGSSINNQTGGRIAVLDSTHVLLTLGTFGQTHPEGTDYGKILKLDTETWQPEVFTRGHRNPQGLVVTNSRVWSTEHGPDGGDELNLIEPGEDYGWPSVSYGRDYGSRDLASGNTPGDHFGFREPAYSWLPSIGISDLIAVAGGAFPRWEGDLMIASLSGLGHGRSLFRVRLVGERVVSVERIHLGKTIRDVLQLPNGPIVAWDGKESIQVIRRADHVFSQCSSCHAVRYKTHGIGPDLWGVVGSPVARHSDYDYSEAMRDHGGTWTRTRLDRFLEDPHAEVPGTKMDHDGIADREERSRIIDYLEGIRERSP